MRLRLSFLLIAPALLLGACTTPAAEEVATPAPAPAAAAPTIAPVSALVAQVDIPYEEFTLDNGLRVLVHEDRKAPVVAVSVWYDVGSKHEPKGKTGFAHLFEHLMFNGSENAPGDFFEPLQQVGATDFNGTTWFDRTNYFQTVPTPALDVALFLESDRMGHLLGAVTQQNLTNQIGVVQNEKRQGDNQPYGLVEYAQLDALFPDGHPYGHSTIGSMADLSAASLADVKGWFKQHYGPNNAILVLAGDIDAATARPLVEKYFGDIPRGPEQAAVNAPVPTLGARVEEVMKDRVATTRLYRTWIVPGLNHPDAAALDVAGGVLGGLSSSRLDNILVRNEKLAVRVSAGNQEFAQVGFFEIQVDVKPGVDAEMVSQRLDQIVADFIRTGPTQDEVTRVATKQVAGRIAGIESVGGFGGKAVTLAEGALYSDDPEFYKKRLQALAAMTPERVTQAMQQWLTRPVHALKVIPGERDPYVEAQGKAATFAPSYYRAPQAGEKPLAPAPKIATAQAGGSASAKQGVDRSKLPEVGQIPDLDFPEVERARLSNGIEVIYAQRTTVPITQVSLSLDAGHTADPRDALGTQSLMLALLDEGTRTKSSVEIAEAQERLGATISSYASMDRTNVNLFALSPNLAPSLDLFAEVAKEPAFAPAEVERLRGQQLARIAQELTQPQGLAARTLPPLLYGEAHPYGIPATGSGDPASIKAITRDDLTAFHQAWFRPEKAQIFVVSDQPLGQILPLLDARFGSWAPAGTAGTKNVDAPTTPPKPRIVLVNRPDSPQSLIYAGQILPFEGTDDIELLLQANDVLGGSFLSRQNYDLRETKGWSYGVRGSVNRLVGPVAYLITAPVQADKTGESIKALRQNMVEFLGTKGVTAEELTRTRNGSIRELPGSFETAGDVLGAMQRNELYERPDNFYETIADRYRAMTAADLDKAARAVIKPEQFLWVVVGDAAKVRSQLDGLGLPVEVVQPAVNN